MTKNDLSRWVGVSIVAAAFAVAAHAEVPRLDRVRVIETPRAIGDAAFTDEEGRAARLRELRGRVAFVLFGFTNCADVCPLAMERLGELRDSGKLNSADVAYVMISVDGERDTPAVMKEFLARYPEEFIGLTAPPNRVNPVAEQFSAAFFKGAHTAHGYDVAHSPQIFVIDAAGNLRAELFGASIESMEAVALALLAER
jgi:cytochrome oxidase Cu insertion factor (SCO1/SenC/PrrC family)